ncbi:hypothetical protein [Streptomyces angustmyceticus]|uniref:hypothetical protein n=1 Tax=Streptomyces angustmyceticus TaxID=285578 RepID=UPI00344BC3CA
MLATDFIEATGGAVTSDDYPPSLRGNLAGLLKGHLYFTRWYLTRLDRETGLQTRVEVVNSPFFTCRAKELREGEYVLVVPVGLLCRLYVLAHLLLGHWGQDAVYMPVWATREWRLPPDLEPLFGKVRTAGPRPWWEGLEGLYAQVKMPDFQYDAECLTILAFNFLVCHEAAHVYRRHAKALEAFRLQGVVRDEAEAMVYRRFAETDADLMGAGLALDLQWVALQNKTDDVPWLGYLRSSYAVTMLYALYDVHRKELGAYTKGAYCHPVIRRQVFTAASHQLNDAYPEKFAGLAEAELEGWMHCGSALHRLNFDVFLGKFGMVSGDTSGCPVSALQYNLTDSQRWERAYERELVLYRAARRIYLENVNFTYLAIPPAADVERVDRAMLDRAKAADDAVLRTALSMLRRESETSKRDSL